MVATILSAQATDKSVNKATPKLFEAFGTPEKLAEAEIDEIEQLIKTIGLYRSKAKNLQGMAQRLLVDYGGEVPSEMHDLVSLPGVGRKTANVVRSVSLGLPGLPVDTHVSRIVQRLGITNETDPVKIENAVALCCQMMNMAILASGLSCMEDKCVLLESLTAPNVF
ncbi:MAG: hypothetical protein CM15mP49_01770 [Actinomycetota bacterium]|nr:MAG: hypothetical protein CM15mP49_01770 [Actinomycetota bacterium]